MRSEYQSTIRPLAWKRTTASNRLCAPFFFSLLELCVVPKPNVFALVGADFANEPKSLRRQQKRQEAKNMHNRLCSRHFSLRSDQILQEPNHSFFISVYNCKNGIKSRRGRREETEKSLTIRAENTFKRKSQTT